MSQEWNIRSRGHVCSICGKGLVDKAPVVSILHELPDGYERLDCHPECWKTAPRDWEPFSSWDELLRHLISLDDPAMKNVVYVLAVMLERSKILVERDAKEQPDRTIIRIYEHRRTGESFIVLDPRIRLENLGDVQSEVVALLSGTKTLGEVAATNDGENTTSGEITSAEEAPVQNGDASTPT